MEKILILEKNLCHVIIVMLLFATNEVAAECSQTSPCTPLKGGNPFRKPLEEKSSDGSMQTNLSVGISEFTVDWLTTSRRLYNGEFPGPTFYWKPGDSIKVNLINNLEHPDFIGEVNSLRLPNTTNLHTHGLHISSKEPQDDVLVKVGPGQTYSYQYQIHSQQAAGTYFYHPHNHGSVYFQNLGGMSGMLIIEDDPQTMPPELDAVSCPNNCDNEVPMVFQLFQYRNDEDGSFSVAQQDIHDNELFMLNNTLINNSTRTLQDWLEDPVNKIKHMLVNGQLNPVIEMKPKEMKRFRLLNAAGLYALALSISSNGSSSCTVHEIALDGHYLDQPRFLKSGRSLLVAAGRVDWLVTCSQPGEYRLQSSFMAKDHMSMGDHPMFNGGLLTIRVSGAVQDDMFLPTKLPPRPSFEQDLRMFEECDIGGRFAVEVTPTDSMNREDFTGNSIRYKAEVGTVQEWHLVNTEYATSHPIHIHVNAFQVFSYNKYTGPYGVDDGGSNWKLFNQSGETCKWQHSNYDATVTIPVPSDPLKYLGHDVRQPREGGLGYAQIGEWRDTILVPPLSNITIRFNTDTFTGIVSTHCHLLADADQGMSMLTEIVEKGSDFTANITSGGAYPWSCMENERPYTPQCGGSSMAKVSVAAFVANLLVYAVISGSSF